MIKPGDIAIVGAAESERIGRVPDISAFGLAADAALRALDDAGLRLSDVDGFAAAMLQPHHLCHYLGVQARWVDGTHVGGCSYMLHVRHAAAALAAGLCDVVLVVHGESGRSRVGAPGWRVGPDSLVGQYEYPYGAASPPTTFTLPVLRFLEERGLGPEHLAQVVVAQRRWARDNPRAERREQVTVEDVLAAPMVSYPFTRDMICPLTDGGGALVLVRADRLASLEPRHAPVFLLGAGEATETALVSQMDDLTSFGAFRRSSADAFRDAGLRPDDIDHVMIYDAFAHLPLYGLEDCGFVERGAAGDFVADGHTSPGGRLPVNTNGGGLCYTHTGMYGMFAIQESVRQLRGTAAAQVTGVSVGFVQGVGGMFGAAGALILGNAAR